MQNLNTARRQAPRREGREMEDSRPAWKVDRAPESVPSLLNPTDTHLYGLATSRIIKCF